MRRLVAMALLVLPLLAMRESRAEIAVVNNLAYPEIVWIYGKTSDPDPLPDFALVRPVDPAQAADPNGDANFDRQPDIVRQHGLPPSVVYSKWDAADHEIALMQWIAGAWTSPLVLTDNVEEDLNPRLAFDGSGRPVITWWRVGLTSTDVWVIRQRPDLTW